MTPNTINQLLGNALHHAGLAVAVIDTRLVENGRLFETTINPAVGSDAEKVAMVLRGYHGGAYGTSVEVKGRVVTSRQLNK
jgi:hypothetical protein